jgi:hypothetical protein
MSSVQEESVFLREIENHVEIVIRLTTLRIQLPPDTEKNLKQKGVTLPKAFEDVLPKPIGSRGDSARVQLVRPAMLAYKKAWECFLRSGFRGSDQQVDAWTETVIAKQITPLTQLSRKGRWKNAPNYDLSFRNRYAMWLPLCQKIHDVATEEEAVTRNAEARWKKIYARIKDDIRGLAWASSILDGSVFEDIPSGRACLHEPDTWSPHQLAISLVSREFKKKYQTVQKKIRPGLHPRQV